MYGPTRKQTDSKGSANDLGHVHLTYNPSYLTCFFSRNSIFLSQKISHSVFQPAYNSSRTEPYIATKIPWHMRA
jgi:hypothetical protein